MVVAKVWLLLPVGKPAEQKFDMEKFNVRKLNRIVVKKQYKVKMSGSFAS
jgi:hypothetical protein